MLLARAARGLDPRVRRGRHAHSPAALGAAQGRALGRLRRRRPADPEPAAEPLAEGVDSSDPEEFAPARPWNASAPRPAPRPACRARDQRTRATCGLKPTTAQAKVERALDLFNGSSHQRTIAGLARTLGNPYVSAQPDEAHSAARSVVVAGSFPGTATGWTSATRRIR